jgi:hypothetical protein
MFTVRSTNKNSQPSFQVDIAPNWPILDQTKTNWLTGRPAVVDKIPIYPETRDWVFGPAIQVYKETTFYLKDNQIPDSPIKTADSEVRCSLMDCYVNPEDIETLFIPYVDKVFDINSPEEAISAEAYLNRKIGSKVLRMIFKNIPELKDPILRRTIDSSLVETKADIALAVEARKVHELSPGDESVKLIRQATCKKVDKQLSAMRDAMTELAYVNGADRSKHKPELSAADRREIFAEMIAAKYESPAES